MTSLRSPDHDLARVRNPTRVRLGAMLTIMAATLTVSPPLPAKAQCPTCPDICWEPCDEENGCPVGGTDWCQYPGGCQGGQWSQNNCCYMTPSPILLDLAANGFDLTNVPGGVSFPIGPTQVAYRISWTAPDSDDAWLVLDRNGNGIIDNGLELFGNFTEQPAPPPGEERNGYLALAVFDQVRNGGNRDGRITSGDRVFSRLRLWRDANQNGRSEPAELITLPSQGVAIIGLDYRLSRRVDEHGNAFRYWARVRGQHGADIGRWSVDVFLRLARPTT